MMIRKVCAALLAALVGALTWVGAGNAAAADRPIPYFGITGPNFGTFGDHDFCHGAVNASLFAPQGKPGVVRIKLTSFGFTGNGVGWAKNPHCKVLMAATIVNGTLPLEHDAYIPVDFGPKPGQSVTRDLRVGSGAGSFGVQGDAVNLPVRVAQSYGAEGYLWIP